MEEKKMIAIRNFPVNIWQKVRQAAIGENKTVGQWLADVIERYLDRRKKNNE